MTLIEGPFWSVPVLDGYAIAVHDGAFMAYCCDLCGALVASTRVNDHDRSHRPASSEAR